MAMSSERLLLRQDMKIWTETIPDSQKKPCMLLLYLPVYKGKDYIEMNHWARAQTNTEDWRANLHNLISQIGNLALTTNSTP